MVLTKEKTFTEFETGYVEHLNTHNERTHGNVQAMRCHHVNQPTGTCAMYGNGNDEPITCMNIHAAPAKQNNSGPTSIGQDLQSQLKRVHMPVFYGDKRLYQSWTAAFLAGINTAPVTADYKLLQMRHLLEGEALYAIDNFGH